MRELLSLDLNGKDINAGHKVTMALKQHIKVATI